MGKHLSMPVSCIGISLRIQYCAHITHIREIKYEVRSTFLGHQVRKATQFLKSKIAVHSTYEDRKEKWKSMQHKSYKTTNLPRRESLQVDINQQENWQQDQITIMSISKRITYIWGHSSVLLCANLAILRDFWDSDTDNGCLTKVLQATWASILLPYEGLIPT